jgi:hypothetical protein
MTNQDFMKAELAGRLKVIYECQMNEPDSIVVSLPLKYHYDLQWRHSTGTRDYIEVKNRNCKSTTYPDIMFNVEKVDHNMEFGSHFFYVATYTDNKAIWFQPTEMPKSGITYEEKWIKKTFIDPNSPKEKQKRMFLNLNDVYKVEDLPNITITEKDDQWRNNTSGEW